MGKKVGLGIALALVITVLAAGAAIRTLDKTGNVAEARGNGRAYEGAELASGAGQGQGQGRWGEGAEGEELSLADVQEWLTVEGTVVSADEVEMVVQTAEGAEIVVEGRPWAYALEAGFAAQAGDGVTLVGFDEDGKFKAGEIRNQASGQSVTLRDQDGRPAWAGRGRRNG